MAVKYEGDLNTLIRDLENRGYRVHNAKRIAGAPGRTADILLENDVIVRWDSYSTAVWTEGPARASRRVETYLHRLYESGAFGGVRVLGLWNVMQACRNVRTRLTRPRAAALTGNV